MNKPAFVKSKILVGKVKKKSGDKTVKVMYSYTFKHQKYKKILKINKNCLVHDKNNDCNVGDRIEFYYTRPLSARKFHVFYRKI